MPDLLCQISVGLRHLSGLPVKLRLQLRAKGNCQRAASTKF